MKTTNRATTIVALMLLLIVGLVSASGVTTDRLNFYTAEQHTQTISNTEGSVQNWTGTMPIGFVFDSSVSGCTNPSGQTVQCLSIADSGSATFIMNSTGVGSEYTLYTLNSTLTAGLQNNVSFINIRDDEIFHTLVEYGRGRGNYFYDSMGSATSAGTGTGYRYVPNATAFELNYLHKIYNIKQYFGLATSEATSITFSCVYPYHTVVREHLVSTIGNDGSDWTVSYSLPRIEGSWERMGFLGMDIDSGEYDVGQNFTINCTNLDYSLDDAYGNIVVSEDSFYLQVRNPDTVTITATSSPVTIGNGTSEVVITYTITNSEVYPLDKATIEIDAPPLAQFIGARGELWGSARDKFAYDLVNMDAGQAETLTLVARFDTSASADETLELATGAKVQFVPTWELNAYNPMTYIQAPAVTDTLAVNYTVTSAITSLQTQLDTIETNTDSIISTVNTINTLVTEINTTTHTTSDNLLLINGTLVSEINSAETSILALINAVNSTLYTQADNNFNTIQSNLSALTTQVSDFQTMVTNLVNCTAAPTAPLCEKVDTLNTSVNQIQSDLLAINTSLYNQVNAVNASIMTELTTEFANIQNNFSDTNQLILDINSSITGDISSLSSDVAAINALIVTVDTVVDQISSDLIAINGTLVTEINDTETAIIALINSHFANLSVDTTEIMTELSYMQGFSEELIFLVTDSVGLADAAEVDFENGDYDGAMEKLNNAGGKLEQANVELVDLRKPIENEYLMKNKYKRIRKKRYSGSKGSSYNFFYIFFLQ